MSHADVDIAPNKAAQFDTRSEDYSHVAAHHHNATVKDQLNAWHASRGNKSFVQAIIPTVSSKLGPDDEVVSKNPITLLRMVSGFGWIMFFSGWLAWTIDGYDYFCVSLTIDLLADQFGTTPKKITTAITLTLLFRSIGALIFGTLADRYGRKWTLVGNCLLIMVFELGTGFTNTYSQFLAVRSLFGIAMGGIWGQAAATALENVPAPARGLCSGIMQQGYAVGYLLAAVINLTVVESSKYHWRSIYFFGAGFSLLAAIVRSLLPESRQYVLAREEAKAANVSGAETTKLFFQELKFMLKTNWLRWIWAVCLMTFFNFFSHASQDLYTTYLKTSKGLNNSLASKATIIANCGAVVGGTIAGYSSQYVGRRFAILCCIFYTACWIPLWIIPNSFGGLAAGGFFVQSGVQGAWGIVPVYLNEVSPPAFRALFAGLSYQLGNMASSGSAQIEADAGSSMTTVFRGKVIADYAKIFGIFLGAILAFGLVVVTLGPEADGAQYEQAKVATQAGAGDADATEFVRGEKHEEQHVEKAQV